MLKKQRLLEIFYTALMGAFIAFLQSFLMGMTESTLPHADPTVAAGIGGALRAAYITKFIV
jgi:hypothetical protein